MHFRRTYRNCLASWSTIVLVAAFGAARATTADGEELACVHCGHTSNAATAASVNFVATDAHVMPAPSRTAAADFFDSRDSLRRELFETDMFKELRRGLPQFSLDGEAYWVAEGDLLLDEDQLLLYAEKRAAQEKVFAANLHAGQAGLDVAFTPKLVGRLQDGRRVRWSPDVTLSYCILRRTFPNLASYHVVRDAMETATREWESLCGCDFEYAAHLDDSAGVSVPSGAVFCVRYLNAGGLFIASAFFPTDPPSRRKLLIDPTFYSTSFDRVGVLRHELGHVLGFAHEHIRSEAPAVCPNENTTFTFNLTNYDPQSVMHYFCGNAGDRSLRFTELDRSGSQALYGPPLHELHFVSVTDVVPPASQSAEPTISPSAQEDEQVEATLSPDSPDLTANDEAPEQLALLIGIDEYLAPHVSDLSGCENDVENVKELLLTKFEFESQHIRTLINEEATRDGILQAFQDHLIGRAGPDTVVVVHYSGHGSRMDDKSDDEVDGKDETIVPHDSRTPGKFDIRDDEINGLVAALAAKTPNITWISDSCHSETVTRFPGVSAISRRIPDDVRPNQPPEAMFAADEVQTARSANANIALDRCVLLSGCRANESSYEYSASGVPCGAFTHFLVGELRRHGGAVTYRDIMDRVASAVTSVRPLQHPQLEGATDNYVFSLKEAVVRPYVLAHPGTAEEVRIDAGLVHGLHKGALLAVYPPGTKHFDDQSSASAQVRVTDSSTTTSTAVVVQGVPVQPSSRALIIRDSYGNEKVRVQFIVSGQNRLDSLFSETLKRLLTQDRSIEEDVQNGPRYTDVMELVDERPDLIIAADSGNAETAVIYAADETVLTQPAAIAGEDATERTAQRLFQWARWHRLRQMGHADPNLSAEFRVAPTSGDFPDPTLPAVRDGDKLRFFIRNTGRRPFYFAIIDLSSDGAVSVTYNGRQELDPADAPFDRATTMVVPAGRESVTDHFKLYVTEQPVDFSFLQAGSIRGARDALVSRDVPPRLTDEVSHRVNALYDLFGIANGYFRAAQPIIDVPDGWATYDALVRVTRTAN